MKDGNTKLYPYLVNLHEQHPFLGNAVRYFLMAADELAHAWSLDGLPIIGRPLYYLCQSVQLADMDINDAAERRDPNKGLDNVD